MRPAAVILLSLLLSFPLVTSGCHFAEAMGWARTPDATGQTPGDRLGAAGGTFVATAIGGLAVGHAKGKKSILAKMTTAAATAINEVKPKA